MAYCKFCGLKVDWDHSQKKSVPRNFDGRDHRETCANFNTGYRNAVRDSNHESAVARFMESKGQRYRP